LYGRWVPAGDFEDSDGVVTEGIETGREHEFRVTAVNKAGESDPSKPSKPIEAKARFSRPSINGLRPESTFHCSQTVKLSATIQGEPIPKVSWWAPSGAKLEPSSTITLKEDHGNVELFMTGLKNKDSGVYKLKVRNSEGSAEAESRVSIVGPPDPPEGPLEIEVERNGRIRMCWRRPINDGGATIRSYQVERRRVDRDDWVS